MKTPYVQGCAEHYAALRERSFGAATQQDDSGRAGL
ncbi:hypothetical protein M2262_001410 [Pseudomonas sp. BIGb0408]|uniref:Uncharacterized protein n=1 Tax=Phytopseudomonas flavescens TaxID=29435 RepID=A0A7Y9XPV7_9GAMM|nr:hypothetical protein [Pseudomonas sp. BIGb0408]NYH74069.1 hypothetical protein [Pseudomonas flavescens]